MQRYLWPWMCRLRISLTVRCEMLHFSAGRWDLRLSCRRGKLSRGTVLLHDNARPHIVRQTQALLREQFHRDIFEHPPYSPDLASSDFFLFSKLKEHLADKCFANDEDRKMRSHDMKTVNTNWCQGMTSALLSKATMWKSRERYVPQLYIQLFIII